MGQWVKKRGKRKVKLAKVVEMCRKKKRSTKHGVAFHCSYFSRATVPSGSRTTDNMAKLLTLLALVAVFATVSAEVYFEEKFDGASLPRCVRS